MEVPDPVPRRKPGRPPSFDREQALEKAMLLFWRHGYEATSLTELTRAMGITPPRIYAAFAQPLPPAAMVAQVGSALADARWLLEGAAVAFTGEHTPPGCLLASSAIAVSAAAEDLRRERADIRVGIEAALRDKIAADIRAGVLPAGTDGATLAAYTVGVVQGLSTLARDGATREKLLGVARLALACWPCGKAEGSAPLSE